MRRYAGLEFFRYNQLAEFIEVKIDLFGSTPSIKLDFLLSSKLCKSLFVFLATVPELLSIDLWHQFMGPSILSS